MNYRKRAPVERGKYMAMLLDERYELRLSKRDKETLERSAQERGITASAYLRWLIASHDSGSVIKSGR